MTPVGADIKAVLDELDQLKTLPAKVADLTAQVAALTASQGVPTDAETDAQLARLKTEADAIAAAATPVVAPTVNTLTPQ